MFPLPARDRTDCPVCHIETGATICPNSRDMLKEHQTYNDRFTSELYNPYWDPVEQGFRLGWNASDVENIFNDAQALLGTHMSLSSHPVQPIVSMSQFYLSHNTLYGLLRDEVLALCVLGAYRSLEFPRSQSAIDIGYKMFQAYKIPRGVQDRVFDTLGMLRNMYSLLMREPGPKFRHVRVGLATLFMRWMMGPEMAQFLAYTDPDVNHSIMSKVLSIPPMFKRYDEFGPGVMPNISTSTDKQRRTAYATIKDRYGIEPLLSQLYFHELPRSNSLRVHDDLMWCMSEYDHMDVFGFPAFLFHSEDRLNRLFFYLGIACIRAMHGEQNALSFVERYPYLMSTASPCIKITEDVWSHSYVSYYQDIMSNRDVHNGYISAIHRTPNWKMPDHVIVELFRRICGYSGPPSFKSVVNDSPLLPDEVRSLQAGTTANGDTVEMLNFKKAVSLIGPYINDPSPLPFMAQPRYGIICCMACDSIYPVEPASMLSGCFDRIDPSTGMPPDRAEQDLVLEYKCPKCDAVGCREMTILFDMDCYYCKGHVEITKYSFKDNYVAYTTQCVVCNKEYDNKLKYDDNLIELASINHTNPRRYGPHGESMFVLRMAKDRTLVHYLEHPYNLLRTVQPRTRPDGNMPCPYETDESQEPGCCQGMPKEWNMSLGAPSVHRIMREGGTHITTLVEILTFDDGNIRKRYECQDHKELVRSVVSNLGSDPKLNPKHLLRGNLKLNKFYLMNELVGIRSNKALLHPERMATTKALMGIPLSLTQTPKIAGPNVDDVIDSTRHPRSINHPDTPIHEEPADTFDPAKPSANERCLLMPDNKLALELRHFYTFDLTEPAPPEPVIDCAELCKDWERLDLIRSTMPLERVQRTYRHRKTVKKLRAWQLSHSPAHIVPTKSMPFIPTVTVKERVKIDYTRERELKFSGMVAVLIDRSTSMNKPAKGSKGSAKMICDYLTDRNECSNCGSGYTWSDSVGCYKVLDRTNVARRLLVSIVNEAKERRDKVTIYSFNTSTYLVSPPTRDYDALTKLALDSPLIDVSGGTTLPQAVKQLNDDIKAGDVPDMVVTIIVTDGDVGLLSLPKELLPILKNYGPVYIYQVDIGTNIEYSALISGLKSLGYNPETDHPVSWEFVDLSDGGKELFRKASKETNKHLKS